jgi:hypothetical protein
VRPGDTWAFGAGVGVIVGVGVSVGGGGGEGVSVGVGVAEGITVGKKVGEGVSLGRASVTVGVGPAGGCAPHPAISASADPNPTQSHTLFATRPTNDFSRLQQHIFSHRSEASIPLPEAIIPVRRIPGANRFGRFLHTTSPMR